MTTNNPLTSLGLASLFSANKTPQPHYLPSAPPTSVAGKVMADASNFFANQQARDDAQAEQAKTLMTGLVQAQQTGQAALAKAAMEGKLKYADTMLSKGYPRMIGLMGELGFAPQDINNQIAGGMDIAQLQERLAKIKLETEQANQANAAAGETRLKTTFMPSQVGMRFDPTTKTFVADPSALNPMARSEAIRNVVGQNVQSFEGFEPQRNLNQPDPKANDAWTIQHVKRSTAPGIAMWDSVYGKKPVQQEVAAPQTAATIKLSPQELELVAKVAPNGDYTSGSGKKYKVDLKTGTAIQVQ